MQKVVLHVTINQHVTAGIFFPSLYFLGQLTVRAVEEGVNGLRLVPYRGVGGGSVRIPHLGDVAERTSMYKVQLSAELCSPPPRQ